MITIQAIFFPSRTKHIVDSTMEDQLKEDKLKDVIQDVGAEGFT